MDVDEGFIVGVYNYCDSWCARCDLTSRCRAFANKAKHEAMADPDLKRLGEMPPHPSDVREPPKWMQEMLSELNEDIEPLPDPPRPALPASLRRVIAMAMAYCDHAWAALESSRSSERPADEPSTVILWFAPLIASKTRRALNGLHEFDGDHSFPPDHEGSAKVALLGIDRSMTAWSEARSIGRISAEESARFIGELHHLCFSLEELIPQARAFVRPGFDEPDQVRKLEAVDWS